LGFWPLFSPVATGQKVPKMSKNRHFWRFWPKTAFLAVFARKRPFWAFLGLPRGLFYINPWLGGAGAPRGLGEPSRSPGSPGSPVPGSRRPPPDRSGSLPRGRGPGSPARDRFRGPGTARVRGFTSTPRGDPPRFPGGVPGAGVPEGSRRPPGASPGGLETPPPGRGGQKPPFSAPGEPRGPGARG